MNHDCQLETYIHVQLAVRWTLCQTDFEWQGVYGRKSTGIVALFRALKCFFICIQSTTES